MKYLPIMSELFSSDSVIFLVACIIAYVFCEVVSNIPAPFLVSIIALFVGTVAIGGFIGFLVALVVSKIKNKK